MGEKGIVFQLKLSFAVVSKYLKIQLISDRDEVVDKAAVIVVLAEKVLYSF